MGLAFATGVAVAIGYVKLRLTDGPEADLRDEVEAKLGLLPQHIVEGGAPSSTCPDQPRHELVPSVELDDLQQRSSDWRFLADEHMAGLRTTRDVTAAEAIKAARRLVVFAAPAAAKQLPTATMNGHFRGLMLLVELESGAVLCGQPIAIEAPLEGFRDVFREQALLTAQSRGVRVGLPDTRPHRKPKP